MNNLLTPLRPWPDDVQPGEPFVVPARIVMPGAAMWDAPFRVLQDYDRSSYWIATNFPVDPLPDLVDHPLYTLPVGGEWVWGDPDEPERTPALMRYLGIYRAWPRPQDWETAAIRFTPVEAA